MSVECVLELDETGQWCVCKVCGNQTPVLSNGCQDLGMRCKGRKYDPKPNDSPNKNLKPRPNKVRLAWNFAKAFTNHVLSGMPTLSEEETLRRVEICSGCNKFQPQGSGKGYCSVSKCGCNVKANIEDFMNAANWADKKCPHEKGNKWEMTDQELTAIGHPEVEVMKESEPGATELSPYPVD